MSSDESDLAEKVGIGPKDPRGLPQSGLARSWSVLLTLTRAELKDSQDLSIAGFFKWTLEPLAALAVYIVLIAGVFRYAQPAYPLFVLIALVAFRYFSASITSSMSILRSYGRVVAAYPVPRGVLPLVPVLSQGVSFLVGLAVVAPFAVYYKTGLSPAILWTPVVVIILGILTAGPAYIAALYGLYLPDFRAVAQNLLRLTFLASSALVALRRVPGEQLPLFFKANPLSGIFDALRSIVIGERAPTLWQLLYPLAVGLALVAVGVALYTWREPEFPKEV